MPLVTLGQQIEQRVTAGALEWHKAEFIYH
jgi:hypothetical protein